ncbi:MAG: LPXTG cell wall anchor domain-containing protein, partial [Clostridia bacterium]|nr:LPXTG cell wall anchor domain-containing protein [Clostridia bacterium]
EKDESGKTNAQKWVVEVYRDFYEFRGLTEGEKYPVYVAEYAYVDYQKTNNFYLYNTFYYVLGISEINHDNVSGVKGYYAGEEAAKAALHEKIDELYIVRYGTDHRSGWMTNVPNTTFVQSTSVSTLTTALADTLKELSKTPYNDVTVTDYMSKWINLIPETIKVVDKNGVVVAEFDAENSPKNEDGEFTSYVYKWTSEPLCAEKAPIILDLIPEEEYAAGGPEVEGNVSGDIYRITWNIKDGPLYRYDSYSLKYDVTVDYDEPELKFDTNLPTNGNTDVEYTNEEKIRIKVKIEVPEIIVVPEPVEVEISGTKYLDGDVAAGFEFVLEGNTIDGFTAASAEDGSFVFETLLFTQTGVFEFTVKEIIDIADEDIVYDETIYTVKVTIERNKDVLEADVVVSVDGEVYEGAIEFYNSTSEDIPDNPPPLDPPKTGENTIGFIILAVAAMMMGTVLATKKRMA